LLGGSPHTEWAAEAGVVRDQAGYLVTGPDLLNGDVRHGSVKRCASAVGEGAMAVTFVHRYLATG
jgi:thioredoxin reductase (NADPH)